MNGTLSLRKLPSLLTDCVLVGHARKADVVFTAQQWFAICTHMLNENEANFFLMLYRNADGQRECKKAFRASAGKRIPWAWDTIRGKANSPTSIGFYPTNPKRKSRWAAIDFDAHDGDFMRARDFGLKAFAILYQQPQLFVCLTTSAGDPQHTGWHLFIFSREFYPCEEWTRLLKQVCAQIGAIIKDGICEIFPNEFRGIGKAIRAPGTYNPITGDCGLILYESLTQSFLSLLPYGREREDNSLSVLCELPGKRGASSQSSEFFRGERSEWPTKFAIDAPGTRHENLIKLVGTAFFQAGKQITRKNAELQYREAAPAPNATLQEHFKEFDQAWSGMENQWKSKLSRSERIKFDALTTDNERNAFKILRNWSQMGTPEFMVRCQSLGDRLGISLKGASLIRHRFCSLGILKETKPYIANSFCARFLWTVGAEPKRHQSTLTSRSQWNGDPGDTRLKRREDKAQ